MTISSPSAIDTTLLPDGQGPGAVGLSVFRTLCDSAFGVTAAVQTASYTPVLADRGTCLEMSSTSPITFTIPPNSSVPFDVGTVIEICQVSTGQVTVAAGAGVTLRTPSSATTRAQWSTVSIRQRATNEWVVSGDLT